MEVLKPKNRFRVFGVNLIPPDAQATLYRNRAAAVPGYGFDIGSTREYQLSDKIGIFRGFLGGAFVDTLHDTSFSVNGINPNALASLNVGTNNATGDAAFAGTTNGNSTNMLGDSAIMPGKLVYKFLATSAQYLQTGQNNTPNLTFWCVCNPAAGGVRSFFGTTANNAGNATLRMPSAGTLTYVNSGVATQVSTLNVPNGALSFVATSFNNTTKALIIQLNGTQQTFTFGTNNMIGTSPIRIGITGAVSGFNGNMNEFGLAQSDYSAAQLMSLYNYYKPIYQLP